jgi:hypothetical protein
MDRKPVKPSQTESSPRFLGSVLVRALVLLGIILGLAVMLNPADSIGKASLYNSLFPGRERFPYGENPQKSYNMTINNLDAMFASHLGTRPREADEFIVFIFGDSSVWGTLLANNQTLAGQLNTQRIKTCDGRRFVFYNLGYPTLSLQKDALFINRATQYQPDLILWPMTLESFPGMNPTNSPLLGYNRAEISHLFPNIDFPPEKSQTLWDRIQTQRRGLADWIRYQLYGVMWAATGIDQDLSQPWQSAQRDFDPDSTFNKQEKFDLAATLDFTPINTGINLAGQTPVWLVNEPILISNGKNSDIRYNFFYPRWAYDDYRQALQAQADANSWNYIDLWDLVPETEFTNSAIHLTPAGEKLLAERIAHEIEKKLGCE